MSKNKISDLRDILFNQLQRLSDDTKMADPEARAAEIGRAKAITEVSGAIIGTVREEIQFINAVGRYGANGVGLSFIENGEKPREIGEGKPQE